MSSEKIQICRTAVQVLRACPFDNPFRPVRLKYADQIELQVLVGDPKYDQSCVELSIAIMDASRRTAPSAI